MGLETVTFGWRLAVIADGDRQEVILDVRIVDARLGSEEGGTFESGWSHRHRI